MTIYRGPGGTGTATSDSDTTEFQKFLVQSQAARDAAVAAKVAAELAETNAETAETNAETAETNAETAATSAASSATSATNSATAAAASASAASTSATNASASASSASTSATAAAASSTSASTSASTATTKASEASTSATNAAASASSASTSASTATTQASNAASSASAASTSATSASSSASSASTSATNAASSATSAASSATAAASSATAAAASAASINDANLVHKTGDETIAGTKTFSSPIAGSVTGNSANVTGTVAIANGGTSSTTASAARTALGLVIGTDVLPVTNPSYTGTFTGGTGVVNLGSGQFYKDASGNVGIGTSSPATPLQVAGAARFGSTTSQTTGTAVIYNDGNNVTIEAFAGNNPATKRNINLAAYGGNVGVGTTNPAAKFDVGGQVIGQNFACGSTTAAAGSFGATTASGAYITMYGSTASPANTIIFNTSTGEQARLDATAFKTKQVYSQGVNYNTDSNYDVTPTAVTLANSGFIDSGSFSGMFLINNYTSGGVSIWLCGGGVVSQVSSVAGGAGMSVTYNSGINGYTIQNFTGSTVTLGIFKVRTRPGA